MSTDAISPLRQRMIEDMSARKLNPHTQRSHISSCKRFAAYLKRSPGTATADEIRLFQLHLTETGTSICNRNRIMTGLRFLFRVTLRRLDLAAEIYHIKEPQKIPLVMSPDEAKRLLAMAGNLKVHVLLALGYGAGLRAGEVVRLRVGDIDRAQNIIRIVQAKGRKDRHVMLSPETLDLLRQWWKVRPARYDTGVSQEQRWLFGLIVSTSISTHRSCPSCCHSAPESRHSAAKDDAAEPVQGKGEINDAYAGHRQDLRPDKNRSCCFAVDRFDADAPSGIARRGVTMPVREMTKIVEHEIPAIVLGSRFTTSRRKDAPRARMSRPMASDVSASELCPRCRPA
jgi:integrase